MSDEIRDCKEQPCRYFWPGHNLNPIQARMLRESPEQWRDATVIAVEWRTITAEYVNGDGTVAVWHHRDLERVVRPGEPVSIHEDLHVLQVGRQLLNVNVIFGAGPVPDHVVTDRAGGEVFIVDLGDGTGESV
ncbi:hypothetical protein [Leifsonia sp. Leaf264]|uniref:hypothetical protein n=1 Tax=Leifsonia sp. Leaf264 TaxID=1736314 RepID=UPI0006FA3B81|nr:hypothetical protein [Leifsonia sp. Leaf264]KQO98130.1 hypothetical protein ASF30_08595 [Leifsonia sp. Leaf264]